MTIKFDATESDGLHDDGYLVCEPTSEDHSPLLILTMEGLQHFANQFAAGHIIRIGDIEIRGNPTDGQCPHCEAEKN